MGYANKGSVQELSFLFSTAAEAAVIPKKKGGGGPEGRRTNRNLKAGNWVRGVPSCYDPYCFLAQMKNPLQAALKRTD